MSEMFLKLELFPSHQFARKVKSGLPDLLEEQGS